MQILEACSQYASDLKIRARTVCCSCLTQKQVDSVVVSMRDQYAFKLLIAVVIAEYWVHP